MSSREIGIGLAGDLLPTDYAEIAQIAEVGGMDAITVFGDLMYQPPTLVLCTMAAATSRIRLGVAAFNPWMQHPVEIAGQVAYLDHVSHGRAFYGLVRGAWLDQLGIDQTRSLSAIRDTVEVVTRLLAGDDTGYEGPIYTVGAGLSLKSRPFREHVPLLIGTWSRRLAAYAAGVADEVQAGGSSNPAMVGVLRGLLDDAAQDPAHEVGVCLNAVTVVDRDPVAARAMARLVAVPYFDVVAALDPTLDIDPELLVRVRDRLVVGDPEGAGRLIPDDLLPHFSLAGTPEQVAGQAAAILDAGAKRVEFDTPFGLATKPALQLLMTDVVPRVRSLLGQL